jgi:poly(3-hydroxyalkanoate) depolymerase
MRSFDAVEGSRQDRPSMIETKTVTIGDQPLKVGIHRGSSRLPPLLVFNGIGANLELIEPLAAALNDIEVIAFDIPGSGGSPTPGLPYRFRGLARLTNDLLDELGYGEQVDAIGISWGGALAQTFAFHFPDRCRKLILAATSPGAIMVPGKLSVLMKLASPRRYADPDYLHRAGPELYGGRYRRDPELLKKHGLAIRPPSGRGYFYQLLAGWGWTSLPWLRWVRQPTLVMHGTDDPMVPLVNAKILVALIPNSELYVIDDGHLFLISRATEVAPVIHRLLAEGSVRAV